MREGGILVRIRGKKNGKNTGGSHVPSFQPHLLLSPYNSPSFLSPTPSPPAPTKRTTVSAQAGNVEEEEGVIENKRLVEAYMSAGM